MRPDLHPRLVNDRFGDPGLFVEMLHRREALLFDMGDLSQLAARDLLRVSHVFVTHMHIDHFIGFDALLRVSVGREKRIVMVGPEGTADRVGHKPSPALRAPSPARGRREEAPALQIPCHRL